MADKEEKMLEKDLIFEEVTRLLERTSKKVDSGKDDTLKLAKKVTISFLQICLTISEGICISTVLYARYVQATACGPICLGCNLQGISNRVLQFVKIDLLMDISCLSKLTTNIRFFLFQSYGIFASNLLLM